MKILEIDCCWDCKHELGRVCTHPHFGENGCVITTDLDTIAQFCPLPNAYEPVDMSDIPDEIGTIDSQEARAINEKIEALQAQIADLIIER